MPCRKCRFGRRSLRGFILRHVKLTPEISRAPTNRTSKNADDIVITLAIRTPLAKAKKGGFRDTSVEYLAYAILKEVKERANIDPALVEDICMGNVRNAVCTYSSFSRADKEEHHY